jgi:hypothetical protein
MLPRSILASFKKFSEEGATVGRLLAGYSNIEVGLMHCVSVTRNVDTALKTMLKTRKRTRTGTKNRRSSENPTGSSCARTASSHRVADEPADCRISIGRKQSRRGERIRSPETN